MHIRHKIIGLCLLPINLEAINTIKALRIALNNLTHLPDDLIHHSDRVIQYCSSDYINLLNKNSIRISITKNGDPLENAVAERVNGILKNEYLCHYPLTHLSQVAELLPDIINRYNKLRPHQSINLMTPHDAQIKPPTNKTWSKKKESITL